MGFEAGGVAILFTGFEPDSENGYLIHCLPKSKFTPALLDGFMQKIGAAPTDKGIEVMRPIQAGNSGN